MQEWRPARIDGASTGLKVVGAIVIVLQLGLLGVWFVRSRPPQQSVDAGAQPTDQTVGTVPVDSVDSARTAPTTNPPEPPVSGGVESNGGGGGGGEGGSTGGGESSGGGDAAPTTDTSAPSGETTIPPPSAWKISVDGVGPLTIGMGRAAIEALGYTAVEVPSGGLETGCWKIIGLDGIEVAFDKGESLQRISVTNPEMSTLSGIRVGSSMDDVRKVYGDKLTAEGSGDVLVFNGQNGRKVQFSSGKKVDVVIAGLGLPIWDGC